MIVVEECQRLSPLVRRITQNNPGIFTGPGTNTYLIGRESLVVLDPGEISEAHLQAILGAIGSAPVEAVVPSHSHPDHWPQAPELARRLGAPMLGFMQNNGYKPDKTLVDEELLEGADWSLRVLHTPGHINDHLSFLLREERALFSGDHIMGWSTSVIASPDGSLKDYMRSLARLLPLELSLIYPAHGESIKGGHARIRELIEHRKIRTRQILEALREGVSGVPEIVIRIYADVDPCLHPAAAQSVQAHLDALLEDGMVRRVTQSRPGSEVCYALALK